VDQAVLKYLFLSPDWFPVYLEPCAACFVHRESMPVQRQRELERAAVGRLDERIGSPVPKSSFWRVYRASGEMDLMRACVVAGWMNQVKGLAFRALEIEPNLPDRESLQKALGRLP